MTWDVGRGGGQKKELSWDVIGDGLWCVVLLAALMRMLGRFGHLDDELCLAGPVLPCRNHCFRTLHENMRMHVNSADCRWETP